MNKKILLVLIIIISYQVRGQLFKPDSTGMDYYKRGTQALQNEKYLVAETLLTLSLDRLKNANVYFNRALARFMINDTIGFCEDMDYASNKYFDSEAEVYFNRYCCTKVDTIYYNRKKEISNSEKYRYYEIKKVLKYDRQTIGTFHDKKSWETIMAFDIGFGEGFQAYGKESNIIAAYFMDGDRKCYFRATESYSYSDKEKYNTLINQAKDNFRIKYNYLKNNYDLSTLVFIYKVYFNELGSIYKCELISTLSDEMGLKIEEIEKEKILLDIKKIYPMVIPAKVFNENVSYVTIDYIEI